MKILIAYFSETGNTAKIAQAIYEEVLSQGHEVHLREISNISKNILNAYDLVFLGSPCHDADLASPIKRFLEQIPIPSTFKLVGLQTLYFYLSQFSALTTSLIQFVFLLILLAYRRWYFNDDRINAWS